MIRLQAIGSSFVVRCSLFRRGFGVSDTHQNDERRTTNDERGR